MTLTNPRGSGRDYYLGKPGPDATAKYRRLLASWIESGNEHPEQDVPVAGERPTTITQLVKKFAEHALVYYRRRDGSHTGEHLSIERMGEFLAAICTPPSSRR